jgi:uncharacterized protein
VNDEASAPAARGAPTAPPAVVSLPFTRIARRLRAALARLAPVDAVVAVGRGGTVPGALVAFALDVPLRLVRLTFRDDDHAPMTAGPALAGQVPDVEGLRVLLVDDVSVTGATLRRARELLGAREVVTLVLKGRPEAADVVVFPDVPQCVRWPWHEDVDDRPAAP